MGWYQGSARCPTCGDHHWIQGGDFLLETNVPQAAFDGPALDVNYWRVRDSTSATRATVLVSEQRAENAFRICLCGAQLALVLDVEVQPDSGWFAARLIAMRFVDVRARDVWKQIDYAWEASRAVALSALPVEQRAATVRERLAVMISRVEIPVDELVRVAGPTLCEACGDMRERSHATRLWNDVHGAFFETPKQPLFLGTTLPFDDAWLTADESRGAFFRVRHPVSADELTILHCTRNWGCRCGAGRASFVTRFARHPGSLELIEISIRVAKTKADLAEVDFAYLIAGPQRTRDASLETYDSEQATYGWY